MKIPNFLSRLPLSLSLSQASLSLRLVQNQRCFRLSCKIRDVFEPLKDYVCAVQPIRMQVMGADFGGVPQGQWLALSRIDGWNKSGIYGDAVTLETLKDFHRRRVQVPVESGANIIAFETIPK